MFDIKFIILSAKRRHGQGVLVFGKCDDEEGEEKTIAKRRRMGKEVGGGGTGGKSK